MLSFTEYSVKYYIHALVLFNPQANLYLNKFNDSDIRARTQNNILEEIKIVRFYIYLIKS